MTKIEAEAYRDAMRDIREVQWQFQSLTEEQKQDWNLFAQIHKEFANGGYTEVFTTWQMLYRAFLFGSGYFDRDVLQSMKV